MENQIKYNTRTCVCLIIQLTISCGAWINVWYITRRSDRNVLSCWVFPLSQTAKYYIFMYRKHGLELQSLPDSKTELKAISPSFLSTKRSVRGKAEHCGTRTWISRGHCQPCLHFSKGRGLVHFWIDALQINRLFQNRSHIEYVWDLGPLCNIMIIWLCSGSILPKWNLVDVISDAQSGFIALADRSLLLWYW